ncbi:MAG: cell division protein FtsZ [Candidatus Cloacimonetes bacterium]|nr:cell division protein FtsZ [Candidatus Cloacimonadota bacterium]
MDLIVEKDTMELVTNTSVKDLKITVVGVGGAGGNAINSMVSFGLTGVEYIAANTDAQDLKKSRANIRLQLGATLTKGLGAGGDPEIGQEAAKESKDEIENLLKETDMLIISAGMGGGTGTGAAPVIASIANKMEILTMAIVSLPNDFEGTKRKERAQKGINELTKYVDSMIVYPNDKIQETFEVPLKASFLKADEVIANSTQSIVEIVRDIGHINLDFADIETLLKKSGYAFIGTGCAEGEDRAQKAAEIALSNPLLADNDLSGCKALIVSAVLGNDFMGKEYQQMMDVIIHVTGNTENIKPGITFDDNMDGKARVTIIATGLPPSDAIQKMGCEKEAIKEKKQPVLQSPIPPIFIDPEIQNVNISDEFEEIVGRIQKNSAELIPPKLETTPSTPANISSQVYGCTEPPPFLKKLFS